MTTRRSLYLCLLSCTAIATAQADIYRWTDASGRVHFSNQKPSGNIAGQVETFQGKARVSIVDAYQGSETGAVKIRMFTTQWCSVCKKAKAYLHEKGIAFEELDVEASASAQAEFQRLGGKGVPVILVGKQRMDGFDADGMANLLAEAGL